MPRNDPEHTLLELRLLKPGAVQTCQLIGGELISSSMNVQWAIGDSEFSSVVSGYAYSRSTQGLE